MDATRKQAVIDRNVDRLRREYPDDFDEMPEWYLRDALDTLIDNPEVADTDADHALLPLLWQLACLY
ncbi:hypothetical protein ACTQV2_01010 [Bifidobacterium thermophilum]|uniref:hypothetical protein n=1 Tax=Bifidobacterium thermophilum TaxID=33905 RepID=UPI003F90286D